MHPIKQELADDIFRLVNEVCSSMAKAEKVKTSAPIKLVLNLSDDEASNIIRRTVHAMPDRIFYLADPKHRIEMCGMIAKELILFHAQENWNDEEYALHYINFLQNLINDIDQAFYA